MLAPAQRAAQQAHGISAEAICDLPPALSGGKPRWRVLYDAPGADRKEGENTVFGDLLRHD